MRRDLWPPRRPEKTINAAEVPDLTGKDEAVVDLTGADDGMPAASAECCCISDAVAPGSGPGAAASDG